MTFDLHPCKSAASLAGAEVVSLRGYQQAFVGNIRASLQAGHRRVMAYLPTGGGKTRVATAIAQMTLSKSAGRVIILANRKQLVHQFAAALRSAGLDVGILQGESTTGLQHRVIVASIDTIHARRCVLDDVALFVIDEAHAVAGSVKYRELLFRYNRVRTIGLSATPFAPGLGKHYDELKGELFQELVVGATIQELVGLGFLVDCDVFAPADPDLTGVKTQRSIGGELDYNETQLAEAMNKPALTGDVVLHWKRYANGKQTVVFAVTIAHSMALVAAFLAAGITAEHIDYHAADDERAAILGRFSRGETMVLSNSALLAEGWDCPSTEVMILARPTKSLIRFIQMAGRVLRPAPGKERAILLDHSGTVLRLGFPTDDLPLELDDGTANKSGKTKQERKVSEPKACPSCKYVRPAGVHACPSCGFAPTRQSDVEVMDGELVKLDRKTKKPATPDRKQHVYSQLLQVCRAKGYRPGWAANQYREFFGVWPRGLRDVPAAPTDELLGWLKSQAIRFAKAREKAEVRHGAP